MRSFLTIVLTLTHYVAVNNQCTGAIAGLADLEWPSQWIKTAQGATLRVLVQGAGPTVVVVPSYGRDGGDDFNFVTAAMVQAGYLVLRPQPRGMLGSVGPMEGVTLDDLAADVADVIDALGGGRAIVLGT